MTISARTECVAQRGVTLFEMLVALSILSMSAGVAAAAIARASPRLAVDRTADTLVLDLKRARLLAETSGAPVTVRADINGYDIPALKVARDYPRGLIVAWNGEDAFEVSIGGGLDQAAAEILLSKGNSEARVSVAPVTGRIRRGG